MLVATILYFIADYSAYKIDRRKEDDLAVRKRLIAEIDKSKEHLKNVLETFHEKNATEDIAALRKVVDELDMFSNEIDLSEMGHKYPFFSIQSSAGTEEIEKLVIFDKALLEKITTVTETCYRLENSVIENENLDYVRELAKVRQYITKARNEYRNRTDYIKGLK